LVLARERKNQGGHMDGLGSIGMILGVIAVWLVLQVVLRKAGVPT
jgi:hypothetical protein